MGELVQDIADLVSDLADPRPHTERVPYWDHNRHRRFRIHTTIQPGLLTQLYNSVPPAGSTTDDGGRPHPTSRPPLALEALSRHTTIAIATARWCWSLRLDLRDTAEGNLRALVGAAPRIDHDTAVTLLDELRQWRRWCAVMTGWETPLFAPRVPCPACEKTGTLRINLTAQAAACTTHGCPGAWDPDTIGVLADHIRRATGAQAA